MGNPSLSKACLKNFWRDLCRHIFTGESIICISDWCKRSPDTLLLTNSEPKSLSFRSESNVLFDTGTAGRLIWEAAVPKQYRKSRSDCLSSGDGSGSKDTMKLNASRSALISSLESISSTCWNFEWMRLVHSDNKFAVFWFVAVVFEPLNIVFLKTWKIC